LQQSIADRVAEIVRIPSVNPLQAGPRSGDGGERDLALWLADRVDAMGGEVVVDDVLDGRPNVYARFAGSTDRALTVDVHLDTVGVENMARDPFDGAIEDGRVFGRGSVDTKATLAVVMHVLDELRTQGRRPGPTVNLVGTVSEEVGGLLGAARYAEWLGSHGQDIDQLVVAEPTSCRPVYGHKGGVGLEITVHGHAAHSSKPHLGQNAISAAARIVTALDVEHERLVATAPTTAVGTGTISVNEVQGGLARNIVPDCCSLFAGRRLAPGEDPGRVFAGLTDLVERSATPLDVDVVMQYGHGFEAFYQDPDSPLIHTLSDLAGASPETAAYGSNALMYGSLANEAVVFGPGSIDQAHQAVEWVDISELERAADIYRHLLGR